LRTVSACWRRPRGRHEQPVPSARSAPGMAGVHRDQVCCWRCRRPPAPAPPTWRTGDGGDSGACHDGTTTGPLERSSSPPVTTSTTRRRADESGAPRGVLARGAWPRTGAGRNPERGERASDEPEQPDEAADGRTRVRRTSCEIVASSSAVSTVCGRMAMNAPLMASTEVATNYVPLDVAPIGGESDHDLGRAEAGARWRGPGRPRRTAGSGSMSVAKRRCRTSVWLGPETRPAGLIGGTAVPAG
jgi:hypothetical protein